MLTPTNATGDITDEDFGDEDGSGRINNLPGSMLLASAEVDCERNTPAEDDDEPAKKQKRKPIYQSGTGSTPTWPVTRLPGYLLMLTWMKLKQKNYRHWAISNFSLMMS